MKLTNLQNLPDPLVRAVEWSDYDREGCDYTVSELNTPARILALRRKHEHQLTEDASERLWMLLGSAGHVVNQRSAKNGLVEERAIVEIEVDGKAYKVGGKLDYGISDKTLFDYKFTSVYAAKDGHKPEWEQQLNIYRWLASRYGVHFDALQIVAIFRDWSKREAGRDASYPQSQVKVLPIPLWRDDDTEQFIEARIRAHEAAKVTLPECTAEDTWEKPEKWAVKKPKAVRALKLCSTIKEAEQYMKDSPIVALEVEHRPAERPRCESYCAVAEFCSQYQQFKHENITPESRPSMPV